MGTGLNSRSKYRILLDFFKFNKENAILMRQNNNDSLRQF